MSVKAESSFMEEEEDCDMDEGEPVPLTLSRGTSVCNYQTPPSSPVDISLIDSDPHRSPAALTKQDHWDAIGYAPQSPPRAVPAPAAAVRAAPPPKGITPVRKAHRASFRSTDESNVSGFKVQEVSSIELLDAAAVPDKILTIATCSRTSLTYRALAGVSITDQPFRDILAVVVELEAYRATAVDLGLTEEAEYLTRIIDAAGQVKPASATESKVPDKSARRVPKPLKPSLPQSLRTGK
jgi:hypothetical protein